MRLSRIVVSVGFLVAATLLFTVVPASLAPALGWTARLQLVPLAMSASLTAIACWLVATVIFGRVYCSSICPLGAMQDVFSRIPRLSRSYRARHPYHYSAPNNRLRYTMLGLTVLCGAVGITSIVALLDPYSAFGRIASEIGAPILQPIFSGEVAAGSLAGLLIALLTLAGLAIAAWRKGRIFCNTLCPVGSSLSIASRYSLFHFDIDTDVCTNCRACEHACKSSCISMADHVVDTSRCVVCFDCVDACSTGAIRYTTRRKRLSIPMLQRIAPAAPSAISTPGADVAPINPAPDVAPIKAAPEVAPIKAAPEAAPVKIDRRKFLATGLIVAATPALSALADRAERISAIGTGRKPLKPLHYVAPPGRHSMHSFLEKCTGCGLCVSRCPGRCLTPSSNQMGWSHILVPIMDYDRGYCHYDCTLCTELCPTGALTPLTPPEKQIFIIGHARVEPANCIGCGRCAAKCPRDAISMIPRSPGGPRGSSRRMAAVDTSLCIGCGACQNVCPPSPKAIIVDGII